MHKTVSQLLETKGTTVWSVSPDTTVFESLRLMAEKNVGALVVLDQSRLVGIFSERDYARKCILAGKHSQTTSVSQLMSTKVVCVGPKDSMEDCMKLMSGRHVRHLPVMENDKVIGIISISDVVRAIIRGHEFTIEQLERYITGV